MNAATPVEARKGKTIILVAGLPYSGKTAIIKQLQAQRPGAALYIDFIFREFVEEKDVCLERWLEAGSRLVDRITEEIGAAGDSYVYVEIGILQPEHRTRLMRWIVAQGHELVPVLLECRSRDAVIGRQAERERQLASQPDRLKIAIGMEELDGPISAAFVRPVKNDGFLAIDTAEAIGDNVRQILAQVDRTR